MADLLSSPPVAAAQRHFAVSILLTVALALLLGIGSARIAIHFGSGFGGVEIGPWQHYPKLGTFEIDPYAHAAIIRRNELPLGLGEGQSFSAMADSSGLPLNSSCDYLVRGTVPQARAWTLTAHRLDGGLFNSTPSEPVLTSAMALYEKDNSMTVALSSEPQPANWLPLPDKMAFVLVMRLYDSATNVVMLARRSPDFPSIERLSCKL